MDRLPEFETTDLKAFAAALAARSKALKRRFFDVALCRGADSGGDYPEIAEATFRKLRSPKSKSIRLVIWPDRWVWVDAREAGPAGWKWSFNAEGRISSAKTWADLIRSVEDLDVLFSSSADHSMVDRASAAWDAVLLKGPSGTISRFGRN